jgi:pantoate--beta-alanine ligase
VTAVARTRGELATARLALPGPVAVVMTMGALHDGHAALIRAARARAASVIVTIFVNPLQFGAGEDLDRYPRTLDADLQVCAAEGAALVFAPAPEVVYPQRPQVTVSAGPLGERFEGASRPGHFDGVLTVVAKLLHVTGPGLAFFGEKDFQQLALVRRMVADLDIPVRIVGVPTVREPDGLALSSRNRYLSAEQRVVALRLSAALQAGVSSADRGRSGILAAAHRVLDSVEALELDYLALVDEATFDDVRPGATGPARLLVAAKVGTTRLIDNAALVLGTGEPG